MNEFPGEMVNKIETLCERIMDKVISDMERGVLIEQLVEILSEGCKAALEDALRADPSLAGHISNGAQECFSGMVTGTFDFESMIVNKLAEIPAVREKIVREMQHAIVRELQYHVDSGGTLEEIIEELKRGAK